METYYGLYTIGRERSKREVLVDVASHNEMVVMYPIFNDTINGNHINSGRKIPQSMAVPVTAGCAKILRKALKRESKKKDLTSCAE